MQDFNCRCISTMLNKDKTFFSVPSPLIAEFTAIILDNKCTIIDRTYTEYTKLNITISSSSENHLKFVVYLYNKLIKEYMDEIK